jgi:hypothetical protein
MTKKAPHSDVAIRGIIVYLKSPYGGGLTARDVYNKLFAHLPPEQQLSISQINTIYRTAIERGFDPDAPWLLRDEYIRNAPRSGRPTKQTDEVKSLVVNQISENASSRELTCDSIANEVSNRLSLIISAMTIWRVLKSEGYNKVKPTRKPGLTAEQRTIRLAWCLDHQDWTLEDWKNVIWSDETSVILGLKRGSTRLWRKTSEAVQDDCIRRRWKGFTEFMFWGCFSYDKKGPCHVWKSETVAEKRAAQKEIDVMNAANEPLFKADWELETAMKRTGLRNKPGKKPEWRFTKDTKKLVRDSNGGIDWYRYRKEILEKKLIPFAKECQKERPATIVQEDKAPSHRHWSQETVFSLHQVTRLIWPGNSPDINAIEPSWPWMKRNTQKNGVLKNKKIAEEVWPRYWQAMPQTVLQAFVERIPWHIQQIIRLGGGNEYKEGRLKAFDWRQLSREVRFESNAPDINESDESDQWEFPSEVEESSEEE